MVAAEVAPTMRKLLSIWYMHLSKQETFDSHKVHMGPRLQATWPDPWVQEAIVTSVGTSTSIQYASRRAHQEKERARLFILPMPLSPACHLGSQKHTSIKQWQFFPVSPKWLHRFFCGVNVWPTLNHKLLDSWEHRVSSCPSWLWTAVTEPWDNPLPSSHSLLAMVLMERARMWWNHRGHSYENNTVYRIISNIGAAPIKAPPRANPTFPLPIVSTPGHWNYF